jgi:hypothetical protein
MPKRRTIGTSPLDAVIPVPVSETRSESAPGETLHDRASEPKPGSIEASNDANDAIGFNAVNGSIDAITEKTPVSNTRPKERLTVHLSSALVERCRNAVYWTPGLTLAGLAEEALGKSVDAMEQERGEPFAARTGELKAGRPVR